MTNNDYFWCNILIWQFPIAKLTAGLRYWEAPSSVLKDAVDGQFQQSLSTPNPVKNWFCLLVTKFTHSKIPNCRTNCLTKMFEGSFKCLQGCSWQENPATSEYSKPSEWLIMSPTGCFSSTDMHESDISLLLVITLTSVMLQNQAKEFRFWSQWLIWLCSDRFLRISWVL